MNNDILLNVKKARMSIIMQHPFFASLMYGLDTIIEPELKDAIADTNGKHIRFGPKSIDLTRTQMETLICHEVLHCALGHIHRRGGRDEKTWNQACDAKVNEVLWECNEFSKQNRRVECFDFTGPLKVAAPNPAYKELSVEQVYQKLKEQEDPDGAGGGNGAGQSNPGNCSDSPGDKSEKEEDQSEWEMKTFQAAQMALQQGDAPNSIKRIVQDIQNPKVPWRDQLRHFFSVKVREDYSWRKGNTRFIHSGLYLPCLDGEKMGKIVVGVDTSGSISDQILSAFQSELQDVLDTCRPESMEVLYCDAAIAHTETYQPGDIIKLECHGGGGTDFRPVFAHVEQEGWQPVALIYFTDLYGAHRDEEPQYPVLWACFSKESKVPYGDVIHVDI